MGFIYRWKDATSGKRRILTRTPWWQRIARHIRCCCTGMGSCCGRNMPGTTEPMYPDTLNYCIHGITVNTGTGPPANCDPCWTGDECGVATWGGIIEGAWMDDITMSDCNLSGTLRIECQTRIEDTGDCGDENWGSDWVGVISDISPCVDGDTGTNEIRFLLHAQLDPPDCWCNPLILESDNINMGGICCLGCFPGNAVIQVSVWE